ncbi:MAG: HPF/RaiA family ribosome-associated protein [Saprospiraceae bacterium]
MQPTHAGLETGKRSRNGLKTLASHAVLTGKTWRERGVPGDTIIAKESSKTFEASIDQAIDALKRQLIKYKEKTKVGTE